MKWRIIMISALIASAALGSGAVFAQSGDIDGLKDEIDSKKANIEQINRKIEQYKEKIEQKQSEVASLAGELDLLSNRIAKTELDIKAAEGEMQAVHAEISLLNEEIRVYEQQLSRDREMLGQILREIEVQDNTLHLRAFFGSESFSEIFDHLEQLENVNADLTKALGRVKKARESVIAQRREQEGKKARLSDLRKQLTRANQQLEGEITAKETIVSETQNSEAQFRSLLFELREEQAYINQQVTRLQAEIEKKIADNDQFTGGPTTLSWPAEPTRGISAYFHDPTYPYRHLFEHSGVDVPLSQGTVLRSAAPGYVAWARTGRMYGNYVMIIHTNGIATLYAHMSRIDVQPDQFVTRGQQIGLSGGAAGTPGAGLSTGPHLHLEVRKNGIPTNPLDYLNL